MPSVERLLLCRCRPAPSRQPLLPPPPRALRGADAVRRALHRDELLREHAHAQPLRDGELHCAHHQPAAPSSLAPSAPCPRAAVSDRAIVLGSSEDFEGPDGPLPPSIAIVESEARLEQGNCLTQLLRRFPALHYTSIKYSDPTLPHLWVLPLEGQTAQTGRLADFMVSLGLTVREQDLDYESSDDDAASDVDSARCDEPLDPDVEAQLPDYF